MLIYGSQIIGLPVGALEENCRIGRVKKIVVDRQNASIAGFVVRINGVFGKNMYLSSMDVMGADRNGLVVNHSENIVETEEVLAAKRIIDEQFNLFGLPARILREKKSFGKILDFIIETENMQILKFTIKGLWEDRILPLSEVHKITDREIIFEKDVQRENAKETLAEDFSN